MNLEPAFAQDVKAVNEIPVVAEMLDIICKTTGMGFAAVARVTDKRWIACVVADKINFNLQPGGELPIETTICHEIQDHHLPVAFDHADKDECYANHHTPKYYGLQSYISVPIILKNGDFFGTLCAIDAKPNKVNNPETIAMFTFYADLLSFHLQSVERLQQAQHELLEERKIAELREQFIAVLGHDLRNPVSAIKTVGVLMQKGTITEANSQRFSALLLNSSNRMSGLIDNIMDFARSRLGAGININKQNENLEEILTHVIEELQIATPATIIKADLHLPAKVYCDGRRIAQLFSNILSNALTHGDAGKPVFVFAVVEKEHFLLTVTNRGIPIEKSIMENLFQPFTRRGAQSQQTEGLGLGLYIAAEIAKAHAGTISVSSNEQSTIFTFQMPLI